MPQLTSKYLDRLEYAPDSVFEFPSGIPAFEDQTAFVLVELPETKPLIFMQSLKNPDLCFLTVPVSVADPEYRLELSAEDVEALGFPAGSYLKIGTDLSCLVLVAVSPGADPTVNLAAPITLSLQTRKGVPVIPSGCDSSLRQPLVARREMALC